MMDRRTPSFLYFCPQTITETRSSSTAEREPNINDGCLPWPQPLGFTLVAGSYDEALPFDNQIRTAACSSQRSRPCNAVSIPKKTDWLVSRGRVASVFGLRSSQNTVGIRGTDSTSREVGGRKSGGWKCLRSYSHKGTNRPRAKGDRSGSSQRGRR
jgi:hypothetical protein